MVIFNTYLYTIYRFYLERTSRRKMPPAKPALIFGVYPRVSAMLGFDNGPLRQLHVHSLLCRIQVSPCQIMRRAPKLCIDVEKNKSFCNTLCTSLCELTYSLGLIVCISPSFSFEFFNNHCLLDSYRSTSIGHLFPNYSIPLPSGFSAFFLMLRI